MKLSLASPAAVLVVEEEYGANKYQQTDGSILMERYI